MEGTKRKWKKVEDHDVVEKRDCLAELPEPLLHHILSYLTMKDVITTSVLAKRWRYTWLYVPCLSFPALKRTRSKEVAFINKSLLVHKGSKVQKLDITVKYYRTEAPLVDSWIQFALTRNVNQLYLDFRRCYSPKSMYTLYDTIFCCSSLTVLAVKKCIIKFPVKIKLGSLKTLSFEEVNFDGGAINNLLSSCSILEELSFTTCNFANNPDLVIMNSCVKTLKIREDNFSRNSTTVEIDASFILSFESGGIFSKRYVIKRMESLRSASFVCSKTCW
ncbi:putative F-box/LRR-repeat protein At5g02930 [Rhododendron vialii]|uniref:putative F-box/LRR-repeat protein At5g02930 n=1 Tax=Rhododendron vialii TaxID=182163 RepID=UPI00265DBB56|nr:putative F-box/LRR-repeat protein At5g02930 [Rhododendron vialii]